MCAGCEDPAVVVVKKSGEVAEHVAVCLICAPKVAGTEPVWGRM